MSIQEKRVRRVVTEQTVHCDGPRHEGETFMQCDTITVQHGYGSPMDGDVNHFCSLFCLDSWLAEKVRTADAVSVGHKSAD